MKKIPLLLVALSVISTTLTGGNITALTKDIPWDITTLAISKRWKLDCFYCKRRRTISTLYFENADLSKRKKIEHPQGVIFKTPFRPKSTQIAFSLIRPLAPADLYVLDLKSKNLTRWTFSEVCGLNPATFVEPQLFFQKHS